MKDILDAMVHAIGEQAIALGEMADQVTGLKQTLARQLPQLTDELKGQIAADQEKSRKSVYELQVNLAKLREAISQLPDLNGSPGEAEKPAER
ncbi:MAG TPA: hypothetical protein VJU82_09785 [Acidobacteriaceae bacterium]|nr:hypothetical protein [Acidobacteriaceae bacterium]